MQPLFVCSGRLPFASEADGVAAVAIKGGGGVPRFARLSDIFTWMVYRRDAW
jgi:hypothetical protein